MVPGHEAHAAAFAERLYLFAAQGVHTALDVVLHAERRREPGRQTVPALQLVAFAAEKVAPRVQFEHTLSPVAEQVAER